MDATINSHAYRCFPVSLANQLGWSVSFPERLSFIWDGISDTSPGHMTIVEGHRYLDDMRANATISFKVNWWFKTDPEVSLLIMGPPNLVKDGATPLSAIISSSFYNKTIPFGWMVTRPHKVITFEANEPVFTILPISLSGLTESKIILNENIHTKEDYKDMNEYYASVGEKSRNLEWSNYYRDAVDHRGNNLGSHEVSKIKMVVEDLRKK